MSLKVVMLLGNDIFYPNIDKRVFMEAKTLVNNDYDVTIICWPRRLVKYQKTEIHKKIKINRIEQFINKKNQNFFVKLPQYVRLSLKMIKETKKIKPDVIVSHDLEMLPIGIITKLMFSIPLIYDSHENWPAMETNSSRLLGIITYILEVICLQFVDYVFTISKSLERKFVGRGVNTNVLYTSRPKKEVSELIFRSKRIVRSELGYKTTDIIIGYFGELEGKNLHILIDAISYLYQNYYTERIKLLVIGGPRDEVNRLIHISNQKKCTKLIKILNYIKYDDIHNYFNILDIGFTQFNHSFQCQIAIPGKILDYLAFGIPPIAINYYERARIIKESKCGIIFHNANAKEIAMAIIQFLNIKNPSILKRNAINAFNNKYCWEIQEKKLLQTLKELIG